MHTSKVRNYFFDNTKFLLIFLVVTGHLIEPIVGKFIWLKSLYIIIYSFHMPLFVFISGYFAKNMHDSNQNIKNISRYVLPYIIFQLLYSLFNIYILKVPNSIVTFIVPYWIMWYMFSLIIWQILLPYFIKLNHPIFLAMIVSLLAGMDPGVGYTLSLSRTIVFFPYFIMGYYFNIDIINKYTSLKFKCAACSIIAFFIIILVFNTKLIDFRWFYGSFSYKQLNSPYTYSIIFRSLIYILAISLSFCILILIPKSKTVFSGIGSRTVNIYLLHGFVVKLLVKYKFYNLIDMHFKAIILILFALLLCFILGSKLIHIILKPIMHFQVARLGQINEAA